MSMIEFGDASRLDDNDLSELNKALDEISKANSVLTRLQRKTYPLCIKMSKGFLIKGMNGDLFREIEIHSDGDIFVSFGKFDNLPVVIDNSVIEYELVF